MKKIAVLYGKISGNPTEDEIDVLIQAEAVSSALTGMGFEPVRVIFSLNLERTKADLEALQPLFVFNLVESVAGKESLIYLAPAFLDTLHIPYTGVRTQGMMLTTGKITAKKIMKAAGLPTPPYYGMGLNDCRARARGYYIIKAVWDHGSFGMNEKSVAYVNSEEALFEKIRYFESHYNREFFGEKYIDGREFNLSIIAGNSGIELLPPAEMLFDSYSEKQPKIVDYRAKWIEESFEYGHTVRGFDFPPADESLIQQLKDLSFECWKVFGLNGYARVDFRVDKKGRPWILEINANPCLNPDGGFPAAATRAGMSYNSLIGRIIESVYEKSCAIISA